MKQKRGRLRSIHSTESVRNSNIMLYLISIFMHEFAEVGTGHQALSVIPQLEKAQLKRKT